jgi:site-specific recombinase XerD
MAYTLTKKQTKFIYLCYRDLDTGKWRNKSLKLRGDIEGDKRKAEKIAREHSSREAKVSNIAAGTFTAWVDDYLEEHYSNPNSRKRYKQAWAKILVFLKSKRITHPNQVRFEHGKDYMRERKAGGTAHDSARLEVKHLHFILEEAVRREFADRNVLDQLKVERRPTKPPKPELTLAEIGKIRRHLKNKPEWMTVVLDICSTLGCRFSEAAFTKDDVDFRQGKETVYFTDSKRKSDALRKRFARAITPQFAAYLKEIFKKRDFTVEKLSGDKNGCFNKELKKVFPKVTSHSFRVSFITRCARQGVPMQKTMLLVNHSSRLVHQVYSRLNTEDTRSDIKRVKEPSLAPLKTR